MDASACSTAILHCAKAYRKKADYGRMAYPSCIGVLHHEDGQAKDFVFKHFIVHLAQVLFKQKRSSIYARTLVQRKTHAR